MFQLGFSLGWICESLCNYTGTKPFSFLNCFFILHCLTIFLIFFMHAFKFSFSLIFRSIDFALSSTAHSRKLMLTQRDVILGYHKRIFHSCLFFLFNLIIVTFVFSYHVFKEQCACFMFNLHLKSSVRMAFPRIIFIFFSWLFLNIKSSCSLVLSSVKDVFFISFCVL